MKVFYAAAMRLPTERAHGLQVMKMCEALAQEGAEVELLVPRRANSIGTDPFEYYGVERLFKIRSLHTLDTSVWGQAGFWLHRLAFAAAVARRLAREREGALYSRDELVLALASFFIKLPLAFEAHEGRMNWAVRRAASRGRFVTVISRGLKGFFEAHGIAGARIEVLPDGVDFERFAGAPPSTMRQELGIHADEPLVLYTGHLYAWKGADSLAQAARYLPQVTFAFIGGTQRDLKDFKGIYGSLRNVRLLGWRPHAEMPGHLSAADVLVLPNSGIEDISRLYTSPLKMFEYMAAGKPIVASDLPSIREILDEATAYFTPPDDPEALARVIGAVLADPAGARRRGQAAQQGAKAYSWRERAKKLIADLAS
ncbi:MAG TPA: glycosyltransferase family 4 protein [Candidatus Paceibacterota bacterium]|nr:glycosyltransferase family 4 protein [Candidatus Paceibacterota bacterium]